MLNRCGVHFCFRSVSSFPTCVKSEIPAKQHASWSSEIKLQLTMASLPGQGVAVNSRGFRSGKIHEEIVKSLFRCSEIGASSTDGTTASLLSKKQQKKRTVPVRHKDIPEARLWQLSVSPSLVMKNPKTSCTAFNYHKR